jgi:hypothetical protein
VEAANLAGAGTAKEQYFLTPDGDVMASEVNGSGAAFQAGIPKLLFVERIGQWDVSSDGTRFLFPILDGGEKTQSPFTVVLHWIALLKKSVRNSPEVGPELRGLLPSTRAPFTYSCGEHG